MRPTSVLDWFVTVIAAAAFSYAVASYVGDHMQSLTAPISAAIK